ncbi:hypothetical protein Tco_0601473 [Tanacetum coccineum]
MLAIPLHSQSTSMAEIVSKEAQKKSKAGICFSLLSKIAHLDVSLQEAQDARVGLRWSKINFKKAVTQKIREYDQKLKALINFSVSEAFEKGVQAKVLTKIKKLLPTRIPKAIANYVMPRLNTSVFDHGRGVHYFTKHYAARYYKQGIEDMISDRWSKETHLYIFEALNGIHHWEDSRIDFFKAKMSTRTEEFVKDFNNALLLFIRRVVIQNRVDDIQLEVESYQQTLNLTKPIMFFEGIDQKIPSTMTAMHKGIVYLNQYNIKSLMKLSEVKKLCDGTLEKIRENMVDMVKRNKLGTANK